SKYGMHIDTTARVTLGRDTNAVISTVRVMPGFHNRTSLAQKGQLGSPLKLNVFAGARRIAVAIAVLMMVGAAVVLVQNEPYVSMSYSIAHPLAPFVPLHESCPTDGDTHYF